MKIAIIIVTFLLVSGNTPSVYAAFEPKSKAAIEKAEQERINEELGVNLRYVDRNIRGWTVRFYGKLLKRKIVYRRVRDALKEQLKRTSTRVPANALRQIRKVPIKVFFEKKIGHENVLAYYDPKISSVVFHDASKLSDLKNYKNAVVLHELAHGYHHQVLGYDNQMVVDAYLNAVETGKYQEMSNIYTQKRLPAYALTNHIEYFAELTETYFSKKSGKFRNDYYPFVRRELKKYDPQGYEMVRTLWRQ